MKRVNYDNLETMRSMITWKQMVQNQMHMIKSEVKAMKPSYKKLWKLLIDKDMMKKDLQAASGISWNSIRKLSKGETVGMEILMKICKTLECDVGDIVEFIPDDEDAQDIHAE